MTDKQAAVIALLRNMEIEATWVDGKLYAKAQTNMKRSSVQLYVHGALMAVYGYASEEVMLNV